MAFLEKVVAHHLSLSDEVIKILIVLIEVDSQNHTVERFEKLIKKPAHFLDRMKKFNADNIDKWQLDTVKPFMEEKFFKTKNQQSL